VPRRRHRRRRHRRVQHHQQRRQQQHQNQQLWWASARAWRCGRWPCAPTVGTLRPTRLRRRGAGAGGGPALLSLFSVSGHRKASTAAEQELSCLVFSKSGRVLVTGGVPGAPHLPLPAKPLGNVKHHHHHPTSNACQAASNINNACLDNRVLVDRLARTHTHTHCFDVLGQIMQDYCADFQLSPECSPTCDTPPSLHSRWLLVGWSPQVLRTVDLSDHGSITALALAPDSPEVYHTHARACLLLEREAKSNNETHTRQGRARQGA